MSGFVKRGRTSYSVSLTPEEAGSIKSKSSKDSLSAGVHYLHQAEVDMWSLVYQLESGEVESIGSVIAYMREALVE